MGMLAPYRNSERGKVFNGPLDRMQHKNSERGIGKEIILDFLFKLTWFQAMLLVFYIRCRGLEF
jgi:hypothetical protein